MNYRLLTVSILLLSAVLLGGCAEKKANINRHINKVIIQSRHDSDYSPKSGGGIFIKKQKREILTAENAKFPLIIRTYDGSNQANHPKVLYFKSGWHKYKYWMSYTPYPNTNDDYENPSIAVSQNGVDWVTPKGLKNPVIPPPPDVKIGGHNSDPQLCMRGNVMELWYRYNPGLIKAKRPNNRSNYIYRITSKNGMIWSKPQLIFHDRQSYYSPAVLFENGKYKVWYSAGDGRLYYRESSDLKHWSNASATNLHLENYNVWHQDIIKTEKGYEIVFSAYRKGEFEKNNQCLYYSVSPDGFHFLKPVLILSPSNRNFSYDNQMIYRSSLVNVNGNYEIYYSAMNRNHKWYIFLTQLKRGKNMEG